MIKKFVKYIKFIRHLQAHQKASGAQMNYVDEKCTLNKSLDENLAALKKIMGKSDDIIFREFCFGVKHQTKALVCFVDGLGDKKLIIEYVVKSLMVNMHITDPDGKLVDKHSLFQDLKKSYIEYC